MQVPWISDEPVPIPFAPVDRRRLPEVTAAHVAARREEDGAPAVEDDWTDARYLDGTVWTSVRELGTPGPGDYRLWVRLTTEGAKPVRDFPLALTS